MSVWYCIPSARPAAEVEPIMRRWREMGYKIALFRDENAETIECCDIEMYGTYPGYGAAVNKLALHVLKEYPDCDWIVTGGDDTLPDPKHTAEQIAEECSYEFAVRHLRGCQDKSDTGSCAWIHEYQTLGVMQPTGDRFAGGSIDRIAGSPWMGREFCLRINGGNGPLWPEYKHMFDDEELQNVATKLGVFWQRPDLVHLHRHFMRESDALDSNAVSRPIPKHLVEANSQKHWDKVKALFEWRKEHGFPGHEPI